MNRCFPDIDPAFLESIDTYTGMPEMHPLYTVYLDELIKDGVFDWSRPELDWKSAAYDDEQYNRLCAYFIERFRYCEISVLPVKLWMNELHRRLVYELMPKYMIDYTEAAKKYTMSFGGDERETYSATGNESGNDSKERDDHYKGREISSEYPETLLSGNADYISDGTDAENSRNITDTGNYAKENANEYERYKVKTMNTLDTLAAIPLFEETFGQIDKRLCDELEVLFIQVYTANVNGL